MARRRPAISAACRAGALALLLAGCGGAAAAAPSLAPSTATAVAPSPTATARPARPTATPLPPGDALAQLGRAIDARTAEADRRNGALEDRLNAGTTLPPLADVLAAAADANHRAAAAVSALPLPPGLATYRAVQQYQAAVAAGYDAQADAWEALGRAAAAGAAMPALYQTLSAQAAAHFHDAGVAKDRAAVALGLANEGSASD